MNIYNAKQYLTQGYAVARESWSGKFLINRKAHKVSGTEIEQGLSDHSVVYTGLLDGKDVEFPDVTFLIVKPAPNTQMVNCRADLYEFTAEDKLAEDWCIVIPT